MSRQLLILRCTTLRFLPACLLAMLLMPLVGQPAVAADKAELRRHTVMADGHPLALWEKSAAGATEAILLVHGRTWSALPDFDLQVDGEDLSLMDGLVAEGYAVYAVDLRGYGESPRDDTEWLTPNRAADDVAIVVRWIDGWRLVNASAFVRLVDGLDHIATRGATAPGCRRVADTVRLLARRRYGDSSG
jgi:pimeloyl-ACP methyl ester carboxylesterase